MEEEIKFNWAGNPAMQTGGEAAAVAGRAAEVQALRNELQQVEAQLRQFDIENPGIASGDIEVAAKMMEAGNYAPYQNAVNSEIGRRQMDASSRDAADAAVRNAIAEAKKLEWGLHEADDWMQRKTRGEMKAALDNAKYAAEKNKVELPREYYDLLSEVEKGAVVGNGENAGGVDTVFADVQRIEDLVRNKNLRNKDIDELYAKADKMGYNSSEAAKLRALADKYKNSTVEKKGEADKAEADAGRDAGMINSIKNRDMRRSEYYNGSENLKKYYEFDDKTGMVVKKKGV